jgi:nicotinamidase-related amidase
LLTPDRTALVLVDLQTKLLPAIHEHERVLRNGVLLLHLSRILELPVVLTTQYRRGLGDTVPEVLAAAPAALPVDKLSFGCFSSEEFLLRLDALRGRDQLLVAGIEGHICVTQTVLGALERGYDVHVASDAVGSRQPSNLELGLRRMERAGAILSGAEMASYELLGKSDGTLFKQMLPWLKGERG